MTIKTYQRRHLRAPFREFILYVDGVNVLKARAVNISEGGVLLDELTSFPNHDEVPVMLPILEFPLFRDFTLHQIKTFQKSRLNIHIVRAKGRVVRTEKFSETHGKYSKVRFGVEFQKVLRTDQNYIERFVEIFASNLIYLQALIDSFSKDEETKLRVRMVAQILGYQSTDKISQLCQDVVEDYKGLQWI